MSLWRQPLARRTFLRAAGFTVALPALEAMLPGTARAAAAAAPQPRMICMANPLGMVPGDFFPREAGATYKPSLVLAPLERHRRELTVFSNLDHELTGGHRAVHAFLSGIPSKDARLMPEGNITLDQRAAEHVGTSRK